MDELAAPAIEVGRARPGADRPRQLQARLSRLDAKHPAVVRLAPALVGPPAAGLVRRPTARRSSPSPSGWPARRRSSAGSTRTRCARRPTSSTPGSAPRCGRSRPSAGPIDDPAAAGLLSDQLPDHGSRHHLPLGRADGDDGDRVRGRHPVSRGLCAPGDPGARRAPDVEVARHRDRPARRDRGPRRRRAALRPAGDVLDPGRALLAPTASSRAATWRTRCGTHRGWSCSTPADPPSRGRRRPRTAGSSPASMRSWARSSESLDRYDFAHAALDFYAFFWSEFCDWYLEIVKPRLYDGDADATANLLFALEHGASIGSPDDAVRDRGDLGLSAGARQPAGGGGVPAARPGAGRPRGRAGGRDRDRAGAPGAALARPGRGPGGRGARSTDRRGARVRRRGWRGWRRARARSRRWRRSDRCRSSPGPRSTADQVESRIEAERGRLAGEIERVERKLANQSFVAKAPSEVVEAERHKLDRYRAELSELG